MMSVRCFQILFAEAGRGGFLVVLEGSVTIVLVACSGQCNHSKVDSYREHGSGMHFGLQEAPRICQGVFADGDSGCSCRKQMNSEWGVRMGFIHASASLGDAENT